MINKVILIGRLGKDPVVKHFQNDSAIAEFPLATTEAYKDKEGNWKEVTDWHNIKMPNKYMAERAEKNLKKGSQIFLEGKIRNRSYDDKDGNKRYVTEIIVETFRMLDRKQDGQSGGGDSNNHDTGANNNYEAPVNTGNSAPDDDLPF
jgi:single-strand DNA-binding protein